MNGSGGTSAGKMDTAGNERMEEDKPTYRVWYPRRKMKTSAGQNRTPAQKQQ